MEYEPLQYETKYITAPSTYIKVHHVSESSLRYIMLIDGGFNILHERVSSVSAYALLFKIVEDMKPFAGNTAYVHFTSLADYFQVHVNNIYRPFKMLLHADILRRIKKGHYTINPYVIWSGYPKDWKVACTAWTKGE